MRTTTYTTTCTPFKKPNSLERGNCYATYGKYEKELMAGDTYKLTDVFFNGNKTFIGKFVGVFFEKVSMVDFGTEILPLLTFDINGELEYVDVCFFSPKYYTVERIIS